MCRFMRQIAIIWLFSQLMPSVCSAMCAVYLNDSELLSGSFPNVSQARRDWINNLQAKPILSEDDRDQIKINFRDLPEKEAIQKSAQLFLERRFARTPMDKREKARAQWVFDNAEMNWSFLDWNVPKPLDASYDPTRERMGVKIHYELDGTIAVFATKIHEIEHHLQNRLQRGEDGGYASMFGMSFGKMEWELADEAGAMLMEGEFYLAMPSSVRERLVNFYETKLSASTSARFLSHARIMLAATSREDYVRRMWAANRYNPKSALQIAD